MFVILLAAFNGEKYIKEQIDSIISQSYSDWFLLISDDGSKDNTMTILNQYVNKFSEKIKVIVNEGTEHGAKANFNNLIINAPKGDYYAFCDQDDVWEQDKLEVLVKDYECLDNVKPQLIYHDIKVVDEKLNVLGERFSDYTGLCLDLEKPFLHYY